MTPDYNLLRATDSFGHLPWLPHAQLVALSVHGGTAGEICAAARAKHPGPGAIWQLAADVRREADDPLPYPLPPL